MSAKLVKKNETATKNVGKCAHCPLFLLVQGWEVCSFARWVMLKGDLVRTWEGVRFVPGFVLVSANQADWFYAGAKRPSKWWKSKA